MAGEYNFKPNSYNFKIIKNPEHNFPKSESVSWIYL